MLDFVCTFVDAGYAQVAVPAFDGHFASVAHTTVDLHDTIYDAVGHAGAIEFGHAGLVTVILALVDFPGRVEGQPLGSLNLYGRVGEHPLNSLAIGDGFTKGYTLLGVVHGHWQQAFGCANATRGDQPAPLANPLHTEHETSAYFAQYMIFWYAHIIKEEFRGRPATHGGYRARCPAHGTVNEEAGDTAVLGWLVAIGDGDDHGEVGFSLHDLIFERHKFAVHETTYGLLDHFLFVCQGEIHGGPFRLWLVALYAGVGQSIQLF